MKNLILIYALLIVMSLMTGCGKKESQIVVTDTAKIEELTLKVESLESQIIVLQNLVDSLEAGHDEELDSLTQTIEELKALIEELKNNDSDQDDKNNCEKKSCKD